MKTIYDIAKALDVAPSTVSKALNGGKGVSEKTRQRIIRYSNKVRYIPNANASNLKTKRSYSIGIIFSETLNIGLEHHFFSSVIQAFKDYVESKGYEITFIIRNLGQSEMTFLEFVHHKSLDGVFVVVAEKTDEDLQELLNSDVPCVTTDLVDENVFTVMTDNVYGSKLAIEVLHDSGHKTIGHVTGPLDSIAGFERLIGYREGLNQLGLEENEEYIYVADEFTFEAGYRVASNIINQENKPSALYIGSDDIAIGVMKRLKENGYKIPSDIAIIGFDDIPYAKYIDPPLSTLHQDKKQIGIKAASFLLDQIENKSKNSQTNTTEYRIKPTFIQRETL